MKNLEFKNLAGHILQEGTIILLLRIKKCENLSKIFKVIRRVRIPKSKFVTNYVFRNLRLQSKTVMNERTVFL